MNVINQNIQTITSSGSETVSSVDSLQKDDINDPIQDPSSNPLIQKK